MFHGEMRITHFPYCLKKTDDGRYVLLNRNYKPVGFFTGEFVTYEDYPVAVRLKGMDAQLAAQIDVKGRPNLDTIYFYCDATIPTQSEANMSAYLERLVTAMCLKTVEEKD
jgi:hypothetical protein